MKKDRFSRMTQRRITPAGSMREFAGGTAFGTVMIFALLFVYLHHRVITSELENGTGGIWCTLGTPAALCLAISMVLTFFSAKARILPALVPIIGLGGIEASLIMFAVIQIKRLGSAEGLLGMIQEISMLVFFAAFFLCILMLMFTGVGMIVPSFVGVPAAVTAILALVLFIVRIMYTFGLTFTAVEYNLILPEGGMESEIAWILRSVAPGTEESVTVYYDRLLDSVSVILLMLACVPFATTFHGFFAEQAHMLKNNRDIPMPLQQRRVIYTGYEEYTSDAPRQSEESFELTRDGYYVEKKETSRAKFKRRDRSESIVRPVIPVPEPVAEEIEEVYREEYYDSYIPGEGWDHFVSRTTPEQTEPQPEERKKVSPRQAEPPAPDPRDPDIWNRYTK